MEIVKLPSNENEPIPNSMRDREGFPLRILGLCPHSVKSMSITSGRGGVSAQFFHTLTQHNEVTLGAVTPAKLIEYLNGLRSLMIQPRAWKRYAVKNAWIFQARSRVAHQLVKRLHCEVDLIIQRQGLNAPFVGRPLKPYAIYTDYVTKLGNQHNYQTYRNSFYRDEREREIYFQLEGETYRQASRIFTYNDVVRRSLIEDYGVNPEKVVKAGVGVCIEPIDPAIPKRYDSRRIVFIGRDTAFIRKGVPNLLAGFAQVHKVIPESQLILVGLSLNRVPPQPGVTNLGFISDRQRIRQVLQEAAIYAMTPLIDPSPGVVREAMAMKLPVVASNIDGIPDMVINGETGYLVPPEEPRQLAEALLALLQDENRMRSMGERGYARILTHFTWERVRSRVEPHLQAVLQTRLERPVFEL